MQTLLILIFMSVVIFGGLAAIIPEDPVHKYFRKTIEEKKRMKKKKEIILPTMPLSSKIARLIHLPTFRL